MESKEIFEISVNYGSFGKFVHSFLEDARKRSSKYVLFMNSHMIHEYHRTKEFKLVVEEADFICPDGTPLLYSMNLLRSVRSDRVAGNDMIFSLLSEAQKNKLKVFFYGSTDHVLKKISDRIEREHPNVAYKTYSPPFGDFTNQDLEEHSELINEFGTNILMVGLGCPKQEKRMYHMKGKVNALMLGVGGAFLLYAGIDSRAPKLMRDLGLEWVYRLALEPRRLFKRYFITNTFFVWLVIKEIFRRNK